VAEATSFGGVHARRSGACAGAPTLPEGFIRYSAGCEEPEDLVAALDA